MTLLDTNICVRFLRGDQSVVRRLLNADENDDLRIPAMVEGELFYGVEKSEHRDENREKVKSLLAILPVCHTDDGLASSRRGPKPQGSALTMQT